MSQLRKLLNEIERTQKRVDEGVDEFEEIWSRVHDAATQTQREKHEAELKKTIKKLQRYRDQIRSWIGSSEIKDKRNLEESRKRIEALMERFKVIERQSKTKAYSREGLAQSSLEDEETQKVNTTVEWLQKQIADLEQQIDHQEAQIEVISSRRSKRSKKLKQEDLDEMENSRFKIDRHRFHIQQLELVMRLIINNEMDVEMVEVIKESVEYYVEHNDDPDFFEDMEVYDQLELDSYLGNGELEKVGVLGGQKDEIQEKPVEKPEKTKENDKKREEKKPFKPSKTPQPQRPPSSRPLSAQTFKPPEPDRPSAPNPVKVEKKVHSGPSMAAILERNLREQKQEEVGGKEEKIDSKPPSRPVSSSLPTPCPTPSKSTSPAVVDNLSEVVIDPFSSLGDLLPDPAPSLSETKPIALPSYSEYSYQQTKLLLENSCRYVPTAYDTRAPSRYLAQNPIETPCFFPQRPLNIFQNPQIYSKLDPDTLFFIFFFCQGSSGQYLAAKELKRQNWRFHKKYLTFFQRHSEPITTNDDYEEGSYIYFDYDDWTQRVKNDFKFDYEFLEDELIN
ncbi:hypothetical protein P9112_013088 [Eukaryota sp. TZLM1-RC]